MDALIRIRGKINDFPGYGSEDKIRLSDEMIRAYVGERLSDLQDRLAPALQDELEPLIVRTAFVNQREIRPLEEPNESLDLPALLDADFTLLETADDAAGIEPDGLSAYVARLTAAFEARDALLVAAGIATG